MSRDARSSQGAVRRHCIALHERIRAEVAAKALGHTPKFWRNGRLVVRTPARAKP